MSSASSLPQGWHSRPSITPTAVVSFRDGVKLIGEAGGQERFGKWAAKSTFGDTGDLSAIPVAARLAFEMAINEDAERQALEGELASLERAWAECEGIAVIADSLLVPDAITTQIGRLKQP